MKFSKACLALALPLSVLWACGSSGNGDNPGGGADGSGASATGGNAGSLNFGGEGSLVGGDANSPGTGGSVGTTGGTNPSGGVAPTGTTQCTNGKDDDGDGLSDGFDPECTGPGDNDEASYATGIPGDNRDPKWQDCFFDGNSGAGDDDCRYATGCIDGTLEPTDDDCQLTDACIKFCAPLVPNGCDCFGCCTIQVDDKTVDIMLSNSCSLDKIDDPDACQTCTKTDTCGNTCGRCELCPGKTVEDLPDDCMPPPTGTGGAGSSDGGASGTGGGPSYTCDGGEQVCGPGLPTCALGQYCSLGCCIQQPPR
jgi:hypothetical protein